MALTLANYGCGLVNARRFYCAHCGDAVDVAVSCGERACPDCRKQAFKRLWGVYMPLVRQVPAANMALVTLTLRIGARHEGLDARVERIREFWRRLIRQPVWAPVVGGLYCVEAVWSSRYLGHWNVHIHALVECGRPVSVYKVKTRRPDGTRHVAKKCALPGAPGTPALTFHRLSQAWRALSGDSYVVDITPVDSHADAFRYVIKYLLKGATLPTWEARRAYNAALTRRRLVQTFGTWHGTHKGYRFERPERPVGGVCPACGAHGAPGRSIWICGFEVEAGLREARRERYRPKPGPPVPWREWLEQERPDAA